MSRWVCTKCGFIFSGDTPANFCPGCGAPKENLKMDIDNRIAVGAVFYGKVVRIIPIGAFVEILPGVDGMVHIKDLQFSRTEKVEDFCNIGDTLKVVVTEIDGRGRINLSVKDAINLDVNSIGDLSEGDKGNLGNTNSLTRQVILRDFGFEKIKVIKIVREITGWGLAEAKEFVESCPGTLEATDDQIEELLSVGALLTDSEGNPLQRDNSFSVGQFQQSETNYYEVTCPRCGNTETIDQAVLDQGSMVCPKCRETMEFEMEESEKDIPTFYEVTCPNCNNTITVDKDVLNLGTIQCPSCGEMMEFDLGEMQQEKAHPVLVPPESHQGSDIFQESGNSQGKKFGDRQQRASTNTSWGNWGDDYSPSRQIVLSDIGPNKNNVIKVIREITGWRLTEAKEFVESCHGTLEVNNDQIEKLLSIGALLTDTEGNPLQTDLTSSSWGNWDKYPAGHSQALSAMRALRSHTDVFLNELTSARKEWEDAKTSSQRVYDSVTEAARKQCDDEVKRINGECNKQVNDTQSREKSVNTVVNACNEFVNGVSDTAKSAASIAMGPVKQYQSAVINAINAKIQAYRDLCSLHVADSERVRNDKLDKARTEQLDRDTQAERRFETKRKNICETRRNDISTGFNKTTLHAYKAEITSTRFNATNYECPTEIPDYIMLGDIGLIIPNVSQDNMSVVQAVELQTSDIGTKTQGEYVIRIPYAQRLSEGISLLVRYSPSDREYAQGLIQPLLLKLFMSFPAGKLEATMIDPLELGASFSDIPKLAEGPNSTRIIDTKIWSKEKDIENAIATLRQRLENMTQAYGGDQISRLKKEVVRVLAITDFPVGFNDTALKDLHAIVRNSAALGVCVLICANDDELEKLKKRNGNLVDEIAQSVVETKVNKKKLMLVGGNNERLFLQMDSMKDAIENKANILQIISSAIEHAQLKIEHFDSMYNDDIYDSNNWFTGNHDEIAIPIGIKGANTIVKMVLGRGGGSTEHHALIAGQTGAGKSTLLHTLIMSTMISYSPDEVQMYLLDFKEGVEFSAYTRYRLPSLRVVAINSEREFGLTVLKELCTELETRTKHFTRYGVSDINSYVKLLDVPKVPKLLLIFDEVQELFRSRNESDSISSECLSCLNKLVMQGRAMGIHIILACQDFHNCSGLEAYFSQMAIRIAVKGSEEGAASILNADNAGIRTLQNQPAGAAIYNGGGGVESANNFFQVSYITEEERLNLLSRMDAYYTDPDIAPLYENQQTRVLLTNAEDNIQNCFNRLILEGASSIEHLATTNDGYGLLLGQGFGKKSIFMPELRKKDRENLLVVSKDEKMALSLFLLSAMSVLYEELHTSADKANALVYVIDLFADELSDGECDFDYLESQFPQQVRVAKVGDAEELIASLYDTVISRTEGSAPQTERVFLLFFGINRARRLRSARIYDEERSGELSSIEKLQRILVSGPKVGINSIVWGENIRSIELMLGDHFDAMFDKRIAYGLDEESMDLLVAENESKSLRGKTAVYMDIGKDVKNTHFRPYDVPAKVWIERYAETYDEVINEGGV